MHQRKRPGRLVFAAYLSCAWIAIFMAVPLVSALEPASGGASRDAFAEADANRDNFLSAAEAARVDGLSSVFARADVDGDERLSRGEFRIALAYRSGRQ